MYLMDNLKLCVIAVFYVHINEFKKSFDTISSVSGIRRKEGCIVLKVAQSQIASIWAGILDEHFVKSALFTKSVESGE